MNLRVQAALWLHAQHIDQAALWAYWAKQTMRVAVPITYPEACWSQMEWRLDGTVCTIGELLLQLGGFQDLLHDVIAEAHPFQQAGEQGSCLPMRPNSIRPASGHASAFVYYQFVQHV